MDFNTLKACFQMVWNKRRPDLLSKQEVEQLFAEKYQCPPARTTYEKQTLWKEVTINRMKALSVGKNPDNISVDILNRLHRQLVLEHGLHGTWSEASIGAISAITDPLSADMSFLPTEEVAKSLFDAGIDFWLAHGSRTNDTYYKWRLSPVIQSARHMQKELGVSFEVQDGKVDVTDDIMSVVHAKLEQYAEALGGQAILQRLFSGPLARLYDKELKRYRIFRQKSSAAHPHQKQPIPYRYLIQIAVKHLIPLHGTVPSFSPDIYDRFQELGRDFLTVLDLCDPNYMSDLFIAPETIPEYVSDNALYEALCIPAQYNPEFCKLLVERLYLPILKSKQGKHPQLGNVLPRMLEWCLSQKPNRTFTLADMRRGTGLGENQLSYAIQFFALPYHEVNRDFHSLTSECNYDSHPIIQCSNDTYFFLCPEFCGYAFCECIYSLLKKQIPDFDLFLGRKVEDFAKWMLAEKGIPFKTGYYKRRKQTLGECDIVLEGDRKIAFIEVKKCPLPGAFMQGDSVEIFHSLADGMVKAQLQALKNRKKLEHDGILRLYKNEGDAIPYEIVELDNRDVVTVSLCLPEYYFLSNSLVVKAFMRCLAVGTFGATLPERDNRLTKINKLALQFQTLVREENPSDFNRYIHFCCFRSFQQLWFVLERYDSVDGVINHLSKDCSISVSPLDYYALLARFS